MDWKGWKGRIGPWLGRCRYALLVLLAGLVLLLLPGGGTEPARADRADGADVGDAFDVTAMEEKLSRALSKIEGAGDVDVVLTVQTGPRQIWAADRRNEAGSPGGTTEEETTVVLSRGSGLEETVPVQQISPRFRGALVVCSGSGDPSVRLALKEAVAALTGLGADKISVCQGT